MSNIRRVPVQTFVERLFCECGGEMKPTGLAKPCSPPLYEHRCEACSATEDAAKAYPCLGHSEVATNQDEPRVRR